jgi:hypothetical protein
MAIRAWDMGLSHYMYRWAGSNADDPWRKGVLGNTRDGRAVPSPGDSSTGRKSGSLEGGAY